MSTVPWGSSKPVAPRRLPLRPHSQASVCFSNYKPSLGSRFISAQMSLKNPKNNLNNNNKCKRIAWISEKKKDVGKKTGLRQRHRYGWLRGDGKRGPDSQASRMMEEQGQVSQHLKKNTVDLELIISEAELWEHEFHYTLCSTFACFKFSTVGIFF